MDISHLIPLMIVFHEMVRPSSSWIIPSSEFLEAFAAEFQIEGIMIALPEIKSNKWHLQSTIRHFRYRKIGIYIHRYVGPLIYFSKLGIPVSAMEEKKLDENFKTNPTILHVTAASDYKMEESNDTMKVISEMFRKRKNEDKDIWLFGIDNSVKDKETKNMYTYV